MLIIDWDGPNGGNRIFWKNMASNVSEFIRANQLKPVRIGPVGVSVQRAPAKAQGDIAEFLDLGIRGGMKVAHVHYGNNIYLLDDKQWAKFSGKIVRNALSKLERVNEVSFDQAVMLGSTIQALNE